MGKPALLNFVSCFLNLLLIRSHSNHAKTAIILRSLENRQLPFTYIALDVNRQELERNLVMLSQLLSSSSSLVCGLQGTYDDLGPWLARSSLTSRSPNITFLWFGNSIANSTHEEATETLGRLQSSLSPSIQRNVQFFITVDGCIDSDRLLDCYNPRSAALHAFIFNGLHHANDVLGEPVFNPRDWDLDVRFDDYESVLEVFYKARRPLRLNISGVIVGVRERERIKVIISGKWDKYTVGTVAKAARLRLVHELQHRDGDYGKAPSRPGLTSAHLIFDSRVF